MEVASGAMSSLHRLLMTGGSVKASGKPIATCRVRRFWSGDADEVGHLIRKPGGSWAFHYDLHGDVEDDESGYRFGNHRFIPGEYVSIKEHDDVLRTFRVMMVQPLA